MNRDREVGIGVGRARARARARARGWLGLGLKVEVYYFLIPARIYKILLIQWNLRIKDTLGAAMLYFVGRLSSSRRFKMY